MKLKSILPVSLLFMVLVTSCNKTDTGSGSGTTVAEKSMVNVAYGTDPLQKMDIYLPAGRRSDTTKVIILIHGGGWTSGDKADFSVWMDTLKKRIPDYAIFNINYRLAVFPNNLFPTQEMDVRAAVDFIYGNRATYQVSDKFVLMGASAGGHLSLLQAYKYHSPANIKAVVDFFGPTNMVAMYNDYAVNPTAQLSLVGLMSGTPAGNPSLYASSSPITYANAAACPTIILQGGLDPLVNHITQSEALRDTLTARAVVNQYVYYPTGGHGDWDAATYTDAFNKISVFLAANVH
ncbi:MAG TPA: alpha/beta hydrolase [Ferruginibacter sp.]|jgi:acetyl esterase/lipase|nr:alpha/beta hydrolase [Ferruginibacter sp.]